MTALREALAALDGGRLDAVTVTPETGLVMLSVWTAEGLRRLVAGVGPRVAGVGFSVREAAHRAPATHPLLAALRAHAVGRTVRSALTDDDDAVWITLGDDRVTARVRLFPGVAGDVRVTDGAGAAVVAWRGNAGAGRCFDASTGDAAVDGEALRAMSDALAAELRRAALAKAVGAQLKRLGRRVEAVHGDLARLDDVERLQRVGRLLVAQGAKVPRGATVAYLDDWEQGGTVEVPLDPAIPAKAQAQRFFDDARRMQRGERTMRERLAKAEALRDAMQSLRDDIAAADTADAATLRAWTERATAAGVPRGEAAPSRGRVKKAPRQPYIAYAAWRAMPVYVGRGAADNDRLTRDVARMHDVWMHARGVPGAHVVVPLTKGSACPPELLVDAAMLAVHHSDARGADFAEVTWAERRYVRKPKGSPPGKVAVDREHVLAVRPDAERLRTLLASRAEG